MGSPNTGIADPVTGDGGEATPIAAAGCSPATLNIPLYKEKERVLAFHGPDIYDAKVLKVEYRDKEWKYFLHYLGWNKNWDEWVGPTRLMSRTEENIQKQRMQRYGISRISKPSQPMQSKPKSSSVHEDAKADKEDPKNNVAKGKKRKIDSVVEKDSVSTDKLIKIRIPSILRKQLVDDMEYVAKQDKLVKLPRSPNVDEILKQYLEYRSDNKDDLPNYSVAEVLNGLRRYFDKALPIILLYKQERRQFQEAVGTTISPSTVYGAEHLLRLFVKLPDLLSSLNFEEETILKLQVKLTDFLKFLQMNHSTFFLSSYDVTKAAEGSGKGDDV